MLQTRFYGLMVEDAMTAESSEGGLARLRLEARRDVKELRSEFRGSRRFVIGYWTRNLLQLIIALAYLYWILSGSHDRFWEFNGKKGEVFSYINYMKCKLIEVKLFSTSPRDHHDCEKCIFRGISFTYAGALHLHYSPQSFLRLHSGFFHLPGNNIYLCIRFALPTLRWYSMKTTFL